jgi:hypothetical protein
LARLFSSKGSFQVWWLKVVRAYPCACCYLLSVTITRQDVNKENVTSINATNGSTYLKWFANIPADFVNPNSFQCFIFWELMKSYAVFVFLLDYCYTKAHNISLYSSLSSVLTKAKPWSLTRVASLSC